MSQLKAAGTHVDYMMNIFVTKTFPNHHTMATGFYAETHGVVDNEYYNHTIHNVTKYSYELFHYNHSILPIWVCEATIVNIILYIVKYLHIQLTDTLLIVQFI